MTVLVRGLVLAVLVAAPIANASVLDGPISYNGHDYYRLSQQSWSDAEAEAVTLGGHLVTIGDQAEQDFIAGLVSVWGVGGWIGFTDQVVEGDWFWISGAPITYTNWSPAEPNGGINESCAGVVAPWDSLWNDADCTLPGYAIMEVETTAVPDSNRWSLGLLTFLLMLGLTAAYMRMVGR